jgi:hypothetical protein
VDTSTRCSIGAIGMLESETPPPPTTTMGGRAVAEVAPVTGSAASDPAFTEPVEGHGSTCALPMSNIRERRRVKLADDSDVSGFEDLALPRTLYRTISKPGAIVTAEGAAARDGPAKPAELHARPVVVWANSPTRGPHAGDRH